MVICAVCEKSVEHETASAVFVFGGGVPIGSYFRVCPDCDFQDASESAWREYSLEVK
jgi:hypothetical protein